MFPFSRNTPETPAEASPATKPAADAHPLDALTGGVFSAATSGERAQRVRDWLATNPTPEQMQEVFKELSSKDKGAAKALREKLDELRRLKNQEAVSAEWESKALALLQTARLNMADALAWQRDAAKAGAPLSREPLASLRAQLAQRVKQVEDLQQQVMIQREAALLLAQRIELQSTKPWANAQAQQEALQTDVSQWQGNAATLQADAQWPSVEPRYVSQLEAAQQQLAAVWEAFSAALSQTIAAAQDPAAELPPVPVWADELRAARGEPTVAETTAAAEAAKTSATRPQPDPAKKAAAQQAVQAGVMLLEQAVAAGHTKNMHSAAQALRQSLKTHGRLIDEALEARVNTALVSAGQLEGWQRWGADKVREQLLARAEALLTKRKKQAPADIATDTATDTASEAAAGVTAPGTPEAAVPTGADAAQAGTAPAEAAQPAEGQAQTPATPEAAAPAADSAEGAPAADAPPAPKPAAARNLAADEEWAPTITGRKLQEAIRQLREEWKAADQSGPPNHGLWKRFDRTLTTAHHFVEEWRSKNRAEEAAHKAQRQALITEVQAWASAQAGQPQPDWKAANRQLHQFGERWRSAGHLSEKAYAELHAKWKEALRAASAPLEAAQKQSLAQRQALIAEAQALGEVPSLRVDAVKALQQRWQAEAQSVPLDRKQEQKLWDAFRKPIDAAFNRKSAEREKHQAALNAHDKAVLEAAKALEAANASGDAQRIHAAMQALEQAMRGQADAQAAAATPEEASAPAAAAEGTASTESAPNAEGAENAQAAASTESPPTPEAKPAKPAKPLIAMRGDDRPGARKSDAAAPAARGGRPGERSGRTSRDGRDGRPGAPRKGERFGDRAERAPRLGDAAFRAQREAVEHAQAQLKKLAAQAHGEALTQLLGAWQHRQPDQVPPQQELGRGFNTATRSAWVQAIGQGQGSADAAAESLLRLEIAAEAPTPAAHLQELTALKLKLLTQRHQPGPAQTWAQDAAQVLASPHTEANARRLQAALKHLLRR